MVAPQGNVFKMGKNTSDHSEEKPLGNRKGNKKKLVLWSEKEILRVSEQRKVVTRNEQQRGSVKV